MSMQLVVKIENKSQSILKKQILTRGNIDTGPHHYTSNPHTKQLQRTYW